jgi:hypothetical protein
MKLTRLFVLFSLLGGLMLTACGGDSTESDQSSADSLPLADSAIGEIVEQVEAATFDVASLDSAQLEQAAEVALASKGPMKPDEYNLFLGFPIEGFTWKEKYRNQSSSKGVYMVTGTYDNGAATSIDIEIEGCDSDLCKRATLGKFKKEYARLGAKTKFWEEEIKGRKVFFYSLEDAWDDKHALTIGGTGYQRESRFTAKAIEVVTGDAAVKTRTDELKEQIRKLFGRLPG